MMLDQLALLTHSLLLTDSSLKVDKPSLPEPSTELEVRNPFARQPQMLQLTHLWNLPPIAPTSTSTLTVPTATMPVWNSPLRVPTSTSTLTVPTATMPVSYGSFYYTLPNHIQAYPRVQHQHMAIPEGYGSGCYTLPNRIQAYPRAQHQHGYPWRRNHPSLQRNALVSVSLPSCNYHEDNLNFAERLMNLGWTFV